MQTYRRVSRLPRTVHPQSHCNNRLNKYTWVFGNIKRTSMEKRPRWMESFKVNIDIFMSNPRGSVGKEIIDRGNRRQRVEFIDPTLLFACNFTRSRYAGDTSMLTGITWESTFATAFPCMAGGACPGLSRWGHLSLWVIGSDMASQQITKYNIR